MKDTKFYKYGIRGIVALLCASLISSCAYESYPPNHYPTTNTHRGTGHPAAPVLVGAAAIGALVLAKRYNDKHKNDHYNHRRYGSRYGSHRPYYTPQRNTRYRNHSTQRRYNSHLNQNRNRHRGRINNNNRSRHDRGNRSYRNDRGNSRGRGARSGRNGAVVSHTSVRVSSATTG